MAVKIRLTRTGAKKKPFYRIVATDEDFPRDGRFLEVLGTYDPVKSPVKVDVDEEAALKWLKRGAIPTETVKSLFKESGILKKSLKIETQTKQN